jgi:GNAT superfamily N-acetyltransferase
MPAPGTCRVREAGAADFAAVRACMEQILVETGGQKAPGFGQAFWEWQYLRGGRGSIVVVADDAGTIAGYYHVIVFDMRYEGRPATAAMVQDVATLAAYRGRGIFRAMGGFALERLRERGVDFIDTVPNAKSLPSFLRDHAYTVAGRVPVRIAPLDPGRVLAERGRLGAAGRILGGLAGMLHRALRRRPPRLAPSDRIVRLTHADARVEAVAAAFADAVPIGLRRTAAYLEWRFVEKPTREYALSGVERDGGLVAYAVTRTLPVFGMPCVVVMDVGAASGEDDALLALLAARLEAERTAGAALAVVVGLHPFLGRLGRLGFVRVPERVNPRPLDLVCKPLASHVGPDLVDPTRWHVTLADWDVF